MVAHRHKQVVGVQHLVVLEVVEQRVGHAALVRRQEHRRSLDPGRRADKHRFQKAFQIQRVGTQLFIQQTAAVLPGHHQREDRATDGQWEPATVEQLEHVGCPERKVHHEEEAGGGNAQPQGVLPAISNDVERQDGGDQHVGADRNAVSRCQVAGGFEHHHRQHNRHEQPPVHKGQINLAGVFDAGVGDLQTRQIA